MTGYRKCGKIADKRSIEALIAKIWIFHLRQSHQSMEERGFDADESWLKNVCYDKNVKYSVQF